MQQIPIIERAYQLARSGTCPTVVELRAHLREEGYTQVDDFIAGRTLLSDLKRLCEASVASQEPDIPSDTEA